MRPVYLFFIALSFPFAVNAGIVINEVAWMGTSNSAQDEWLEIFSSNAQTLEGWTISTADGGMIITLSSSISGNGYYLIERTDDTTVPNVTADIVTTFGNGLANAGEILILKDANGNTIDTVDASSGWLAGDNVTKETMQKSGSAWITATGTPRAQNAVNGSSQNEAEADGSPPDAGGTSEDKGKQTTTGPIDKKKFSAEIEGGDTVAIVGVAKIFYGKGYGTNGDPIESADFLWSFGDGSMERGRNVSHIFRYPGTYRTVFDVSSGTYNASDAIIVKAIPSPLSIAEVKPGTNGFIELRNDSEYEIDISYWGVGNGQFVYYFPQDTFTLGQTYLVIPYAISSIEFSSFGAASLFYPNITVADSFSYGGIAKEDESFHDIKNIPRLGLESPGSGKFVARQIAQPVTYNVSRAEPDASNHMLQDASTTQEDSFVRGEPNQISAPILADKKFYQNLWFWIVVVILIGLLSAGGMLMIRRVE